MRSEIEVAQCLHPHRPWQVAPERGGHTHDVAVGRREHRDARRDRQAMNSHSRVGAGVATVVLALGVAACAAAPAPVPSAPGPIISPSTGSLGGATDDGYQAGSGGTMGRPSTTTTAPPHTGEVAGEWLDPADVSTLQSAVDQGGQPWRLDPQMTALAFTRERLGWMMPLTWRSTPDTVLVVDGTGGAVSLHVTQPVRTGSTGIWTVSGGSWVR